MRILFVSHSFPVAGEPLSNVGGMQRVAVELHAALAAHPEVELSTIALETSWRWTGLRTPPFLACLLATIPRIVHERQIEVVLFSSMVTASTVLALAGRIRRLGAITAAIPVGRDVTLSNPLYQRIVPHILQRLDLVFPISRATAETCLARGSRADRTLVVPCGVDLSRLQRPANRSDSRTELIRILELQGVQIDPEALLLLSVGRHQERKGFHWFAEHVMSAAPAEAIYLLAGSGPLTSDIQDVVRRCGLEGRVKMLGQVSDETLRALYRGADLFIMPNIPVVGDIEGFGVVMLEAGVSGMPVIAADLEGIRDVVQEGVTGHLVPSGDVSAFVAAISRYRDGAVLEAASMRAAEWVTQTFGWAAVADRYVEILRDRMGREGTPESPPQQNKTSSPRGRGAR